MSALPASLTGFCTEVRIRFATEYEREPIPSNSNNGTIYADFSGSDPMVEITAPERISKGIVTLTIEQARELAAQIMEINRICADAKKKGAA